MVLRVFFKKSGLKEGGMTAPAGAVFASKAHLLRTTVLAGAHIVLLTASPATAQAVLCAGDPSNSAPPSGGEICELPPLNIGDRYRAYGISADGTLIVGTSGNSAVAWAGVHVWPDLSVSILPESPDPTREDYVARAVNADGTVIVGYTRGVDDGDLDQALRWSATEGTVTVLASNGDARAFGVSGDGGITVGRIDYRAVFWAGDDYYDLPVSAGTTYSLAYGANSDGSVIVGYTEDSAYMRTAAVWSIGLDDSLTRKDLTSDGVDASYANAVSSDGQVVVGSADITGIQHAFAWAEDTGISILATGTGTGASSAEAVSGDGKVIVGWWEDSNNDYEAVRWIDGQMEGLGRLSSGDSSKAFGANADGSIIVGESVGNTTGTRAFIWRGKMQDFTNLVATFPVLAGETELAFDTQQANSRGVMDEGRLARGAGESFIAVFGGNTSVGSDDLGSSSASLGGVSYGYGVSDQWTLGFSVTANGANPSSSAFDLDDGFGAAAWGEYSQKGANRTGLQGSFALGYISQVATRARGLGFEDVEAATGTADLATRSARIELGYGFEHSSGWLLTPTVGITHHSSTLGAYAEDPEATAFSATYDKLEASSTIVTLATTGEWRIADDRKLSLGAGAAFDLDVDTVTLTGSTNIPGMESFAVDSLLSRNDVRPYATASYSMDVADGGTFTASVRAGRATYGDEAELGLGLRYGVNF